MSQIDFLIVGSGGGGATIGWLLAKAGYRVTILEQGPDWSEPVERDQRTFNPVAHDEELYRLRRTDPKRRLRGSYVTFRKGSKPGEKERTARPFGGGWTGTHVGGGTIIWGTWGIRPLPVDLRLESYYRETEPKESPLFKEYNLADWPVAYSELDPFFNVAEVLLGVSGSRPEVVESTVKSPWFKALGSLSSFGSAKEWAPQFPFPTPATPMTPIGSMCAHMMRKKGFSPVPLPMSIVSPGATPYSTRAALAKALAGWKDADRPAFWKGKTADQLWSERVRQACNLCGFCGEYLCWGREAPKAGTQATTLKEMAFDMAARTEIRASAMVYDLIWSEKAIKRVEGVRYLDISDPDQPRPRELRAANVILSCGAVQSARLLQLARYPDKSGMLGANAMFHMFGLGSRFALTKEFDGLVHGEFGATGNTTTFDTYFLEDKDKNPRRWVKAGILTSTAKKNPTEDAAAPFTRYDRESGQVTPPAIGKPMLEKLAPHQRNMEIRLNGDDLPNPLNRIDLDPTYVDEFGFPVARVTRQFGSHEDQLNRAGRTLLSELIKAVEPGVIDKQAAAADLNDPKNGPKGATLDLIGDHQLGTCRMGNSSKSSVLDRWCRTHEAKNLYVIDTSCFPTGFGVNPMVTVMANALRVGTKIVDGGGVIDE